MSFAVAFRLDLPHGCCVAVRIPEDFDAHETAALVSAEREFLGRLPPARQPSWAAGRVALRWALADLGTEVGPILATDRGAPALPAEVTGSITHKRTLAVALAALCPQGPRIRVGVDFELPNPKAMDISRRVLSSDEALRLAGLADDVRRRQVLLRFSAKEALYKALDPFVRRRVSFQEVSLDILPGGITSVSLSLTGREGPFNAEVCWQEAEGGVLTTARVTAPRGATS